MLLFQLLSQRVRIHERDQHLQDFSVDRNWLSDGPYDACPCSCPVVSGDLSFRQNDEVERAAHHAAGGRIY